MIVGFALFLLGLCYVVSYLLFGGLFAVVFAFGFTVVSTWVAYWKADTIALAAAGAQPADQREYARLHNLVEGLCIAGGLPKPRIYVIHDPAPNAFATGRNPQHAAIAVTTGLLEKMNRIELEGVLAHELSHIRNYDILVMTLAVTMVGTTALLADFSMRSMLWGGARRSNSSNDSNVILLVVGIVGLILAPIVAKLMQAAVSRRREALADMSAVELTRYPPGLISALEKLRDDQTVVAHASRTTAHLYIESPLAGAEEGKSPSFLERLNLRFETHPPIEERIAALREL